MAILPLLRLRAPCLLLLVAAAEAQVNWLLQSPLPVPSPRGGFAIAYDAARERTLLFGGSCCCGPFTGCTYFNDTWEWDGTNWTQRAPATSPPPQVQQQLAWDAARGRIVLVADNSLDLWEWDGTDWTHRLPASAPPARAGFAIAYDAARQRTVLFGGSCCCGVFTGCTYFNDTWEYDGTGWTQRSPATSPPPQVQHKMVFDGARGRVVLVSDSSLDLWEWDGTDWTHRTPAAAPPARGGFGLCFDSTRRRTILFGGSCCCGVFTGCTYLNDTWEYDGTSWTQRTPVQSPGPRTNCLMVHDERRARSVLMNWSVAETWEYAGDACFVAGPGHPGGGLPIGCTGQPQPGQTFCLGFPSAQGAAFLGMGAGPCLSTPLSFGPPAFCAAGFVYPSSILAVFVGGNPANYCLAVPQQATFIGQRFCFQGFALEPAICLRASDGLLVTVQP